jgi:Na+:H+ antiporter, NhaA family
MTFADNHPLTQARKRLAAAFKSPVIGSVLLILATVAALIWANSPWHHSYFHLWETPLSIQLGEFVFSLTLHQWINDGLMVLFFLSVGLEIKREVLAGKLSSPRKAMLPVMAALGGMLVPALVYTLFNFSGPGAVGWGVPMATDIAFAIGILLLLGKRVPLSLKVFITALAIIDDIGAVLVIAVFYSEQISGGWLFVAFGFLGTIFVFTRLNVRHTSVYMVLTAGVWLGVMFSGIHATLAGILVAIMVPARARINPAHFIHLEYYHLRRLRHAEMTETSVLTDEIQIESIIAVEEAARDMEPVLVWLEHTLLPYVTFIVIPLFALSNAGIHLAGDWLGLLGNPVTLGVIFGLFVGKQVGVMLFTWLAVRLRLADMPAGVTWPQVYAMSWLTSIGFTMSLFITELAFTDPAMIDQAKLGILLASLLAGGVGYTLLRVLLPNLDDASQSASITPAPLSEHA